MDSKTTTEVKPALYCGTYGKYNDGSIAGKWLHLEDYADADEFFQACAELHKDEHDPEYMFQDFEGFPRELYSECLGTSDVEAIYEWMQLDDEQRELMERYMDATGYSYSEISIEQAEEQLFCILDYTYSVDDNNAMGDYVIDNGLIEVPEDLRGYIDTEAIGRDWLQDMSVSDGYVFNL